MVQTNDVDETFTGTLNLKEISKKRLTIKSYLEKPSLKGNVLTFSIGYYQNAHFPYTVECDKNKTIYLMVEFPIKFETTFKEGIENILLEDHSNSLEWNPIDKIWEKKKNVLTSKNCKHS